MDSWPGKKCRTAIDTLGFAPYTRQTYLVDTLATFSSAFFSTKVFDSRTLFFYLLFFSLFSPLLFWAARSFGCHSRESTFDPTHLRSPPLPSLFPAKVDILILSSPPPSDRKRHLLFLPQPRSHFSSTGRRKTQKKVENTEMLLHFLLALFWESGGGSKKIQLRQTSNIPQQTYLVWHRKGDRILFRSTCADFALT